MKKNCYNSAKSFLVSVFLCFVGNTLHAQQYATLVTDQAPACTLSSGSGTTQEYYFNYTPAGSPLSEYGGDAGSVDKLTGSYNPTNKAFSITSTLGPDESGVIADSMFFVINNGRNPKEVAKNGYLAIVYLDFKNRSDIKATVYAYNGENNEKSFLSGAPGSSVPDQIISSNDKSWIKKASATLENGKLKVEFAFDATRIVNHTPKYPSTNTKWYGIGFTNIIGMWIHTFTNNDIAYDGSGYLTRFNPWRVTYFDVSKEKSVDCLGRTIIGNNPAPEFDECCVCGGNGTSCRQQISCTNTDFISPFAWRLAANMPRTRTVKVVSSNLNPIYQPITVVHGSRFPDTLIRIPGVNFGAGVATLTSDGKAINPQVVIALNEPSTPNNYRQRLLNSYVTAQLSIYPRNFASYGILNSPLSCYNSCIGTTQYALQSNGKVINSATTISSLLATTHEILMNGSSIDMQVLIQLYVALENCSRDTGEPVSYLKEGVEQVPTSTKVVMAKKTAKKKQSKKVAKTMEAVNQDLVSIIQSTAPIP